MSGGAFSALAGQAPSLSLLSLSASLSLLSLSPSLRPVTLSLSQPPCHPPSEPSPAAH
jgi:hypothetical protein